MRPHLAYDAYKMAMFKWYDYLQGATKRAPIKSLVLAAPAGIISGVAWSLLALADTVEAIALTALNTFTCCCYRNESRLADAGFCFARALLSGVFIITIPVVAPGLFIRSTMMMIFEPHRHAEKSYDLFHKAIYQI